MRRNALLFMTLLLFSLLVACTPKPPVDPPDVPVDPIPGTPVLRRGELYVDYMVHGMQNRFLWLFDPETVEEILVPERGEVRFYVQDGPTLTFAVEAGMDELTFTVGDVDYTYALRFLPNLEDSKIAISPWAAPGLALPAPGKMPVIDGEMVLLTITYPYDHEVLEQQVRDSMGDHLAKLEWVDESRLILTVHGALGEIVPLGLEELDPMPGFTSTVGQVPLPAYSLQIMPQAELRAVNTSSGRVTTWQLPYYVSRATSWNSSGELICAQRFYELTAEWMMMDDPMHEFTFSLRDGSLSGEPFLSTYSFPRQRQWLYDIVKLEWPENADSFSHVGGSRARDMVASVFCSQDGNMLLIHQLDNGSRTLYPLQSAAWRGGSGKTADTILWSRNDRYLFYVPENDNGPRRVMVFDLQEEMEFVMEETDAVLIATSDFADEVMYRVGDAYYLHNVSGSRRALTGLQGDYAVVSWLSATSFLVTDGSRSLIYDTWTQSATWQTDGQAIGHNPATGTVWLFVH